MRRAAGADGPRDKGARPRTRAPVRGALFDWDGTLLDSYHADAHAYLEMFRALGVGWGLEELKRHYSPDWYRVYRAAGIPRTRWEDANRLWRRYYGQCRPVLLPGARRVLRQLARGFVLGLVSSGDRDRVTAQLRRFGLSSLFAACVCSEDATRRKPHPEPLRVAISQLGLRPEACVYIGDSSEDIEMARRAGVHAIAVLGRYPTHRQVYAAHPDAVLQSIRELPTVLERHYRGL